MFEGKMMKFKRLYLKSTIVVICSILTVIQAVSAAPAVNVEPSYPSVSPGETFIVNITIDPNDTEFFSASYKLYFNNSLLKALNQSKGSFLSQDGTNTIEIINKIDNTAGRVEYGEVRTGVENGVNDPGILAKVEFEVIGHGVDEFRLFDVKLSDPKQNRISDIVVQSRISSQFIIDGYISNEDGSKCINPTVTIINMNIGMERGASTTNENFNYYKIEVVGGVDIISGEVLRFNVISPDGNQSNVKDHKVTEDEIESGGIFNFNITLASDITPPADNTDIPSTSSGSSGGGSGTSGEAFENILISDTEREYVNKDSEISYHFNTEGNVVQYINFTGLTNSGQIVAKVEILNHTSTLVNHPPADIIYTNLNIWVGNLGWANSGNIANPTVKFKVEKTWIGDNNIDKSSVKLNRYTEEAWNQLVTIAIGEDADYMYFEAETSGFSPFAITGKEMSISSGVSEMNTVAESGVMEEEPDKVPDQTPVDTIPGFNLFACVLMLLTVVKILYKRN